MTKSKTQREFITGLDIGSSSVRVAIGQIVYGDNSEPSLQILGAVEVPSDGVHKGAIVSIEDTVSAVSSAMERAEQLIGVPIEHVWVGVSSPDILSQESRGVIAVSRNNGEISQEDVERAVEAARQVASPLNYDVLHVLPRSFTVDGQTGIKDPVGMTGVRLEVDTKIIHGSTTHLKNIERAVYRTGLDIEDFVLTSLAAADVVVSPRQKELGVVVINIGGPTTSMAVYEEGDMLHAAVLPIGAAHITNDLALGLKTSIEMAEKIKVEYGESVSRGISKKDMIDLASLGQEQSEIVSRQYIAEIIEARVSEILEKVDAELERIGKSGMLPAGAVFVGSGSKIRGLTDAARAYLRLPAVIGRPQGIAGAFDDTDDAGMIPVIGLVKWGAGMYQGRSRRRFSFDWRKVMNKMQKLFRSFVP